MRVRVASRVVALFVAMALTVSGALACFPVGTAHATARCCVKHCHQDASASLSRCCCTPSPAPVAPASVASATPPPSLFATALDAPAHLAATVVTTVRPWTHPPPGGPLFQQRCTLLL